MRTGLFKGFLLVVLTFWGTLSVSCAITGSGTMSKKKKTEVKVDSIPQFTVKKLTMLDERGDTIRYEDGSVQYHYVVYDKDDKVCDPETAKKLTNAALKSTLVTFLKVGGSTAVGSGIGKKLGGKKGAWIGGAVGFLGGLALSAGDIKKTQEDISLLKQYKAELKKYQETFTEEGLPVDASADLSAYNDCEELTAGAREVREQLAASKAQGATLEDISDEELEKMMADAEKKTA
ncbi:MULTISPECIES: hypothetical protein [Bacteroidales]|uniref:Glycine zipper family protein n=1 Tax=Parabacteroides merdae TaxID=46503 RepID=A0AA43W5N2_9BACT|nr:hypothetical protein [Parabacteroides merdae]MTU51455.1 hypothetical protein [Parabacteroides merdae]MTU62964.1 hypothetical protein [Parabacteroides merdae]MTU64262.1 hypothetical protein [Parabacteroides merdae]MTU70827.1 hypothetical protein [Parabacteroides merdae]MTU74305.1 hypothetical protein [Parabacteroides merdae]